MTRAPQWEDGERRPKTPLSAKYRTVVVKAPPVPPIKEGTDPVHYLAAFGPISAWAAPGSHEGQEALSDRYVTSSFSSTAPPIGLVEWWEKVAQMEMERVSVVKAMTEAHLATAGATPPARGLFHARSLFFEGRGGAAQTALSDTERRDAMATINTLGQDAGDQYRSPDPSLLAPFGVPLERAWSYTFSASPERRVWSPQLRMLCKWYSECFLSFRYCFGAETRLVTTRIWKALEEVLIRECSGVCAHGNILRLMLTPVAIHSGFFTIFTGIDTPCVEVMALLSAMLEVASRATTAEYLHHPSVMITRLFTIKDDC